MSGRTEGHLLGGRVRYAQPDRGFRSGIEPVLLAAAVPARPGERVLEGGSGAGAGLLCLAFRVPGIDGLGIERDEALAGLACENAVANGFRSVRFLAGDIQATPGAETVFDHAFANPPYHLLSGTRPEMVERDRAKHGGEDVIIVWAVCLAARLRPGGTLTLAAPASRLPDCILALQAAGCGSGALLPLWPRSGEAAKLVLIQGIRQRKGPFRVLSGLPLHAGLGGYSGEADAVLRGGAALRI